MRTGPRTSVPCIESVGQREGQLCDRIGTRFGDVITADTDTVEILYVVMNKILLHIAHQLQCEFRRENAGILCLIFFQNIRLNSSTHLRKSCNFNLLVHIIGQYLIACYTQKQ